MLREQLQEVEEKIQAACDRAGRQRSEVTLIVLPPAGVREPIYSAAAPSFSAICFSTQARAEMGASMVPRT